MFAGHYAPALALRRADSGVPLWALLLATQAVDVGFSLLVLSGLESAELRPDAAPRLHVTHGVYTHSLLMTGVYAAAIILLGRALDRPRAGLVLAAAMASHWLGDFLVHDPDLPLAFDDAHAVGLSLWSWPVAAWALEVGLLLAAGAFWLRPLQGRARRRGTTLVVGLVVMQTLADFVSPLPPDDIALAITMLPTFLAIATAGWWAERT